MIVVKQGIDPLKWSKLVICPICDADLLVITNDLFYPGNRKVDVVDTLPRVRCDCCKTDFPCSGIPLVIMNYVKVRDNR